MVNSPAIQKLVEGLRVRNQVHVVHGPIDIPEFKAMLVAFYDILEFQPPSDDTNRMLSSVLFEWRITELGTLRPEKPESFKFQESLPSVSARRTDGDCPICTEPFESCSSTQREGAVIAKRMPCNHLMCKSCLDLWLCPLTVEGNNSCPSCRGKFFEKMPPVNYLAGIKARINAAEYYRLSHKDEMREDLKPLEIQMKLRLVACKMEDAMREVREQAIALPMCNKNNHRVFEEHCYRMAMIAWVNLEVAARAATHLLGMEGLSQEFSELYIMHNLAMAEGFGNWDKNPGWRVGP